jgi:hypothetical protein
MWYTGFLLPELSDILAKDEDSISFWGIGA